MGRGEGPEEPNIEWFKSGTFERSKFDQFLLSPTHPKGKHKSRWLSSTYGFKQGDGELMERLIREQLDQAEEIREKDPVLDADDPSLAYRLWEIVIPRFRGPNGNVQPILTAWALDPRRDKPHFTNAYRVR